MGLVGIKLIYLVINLSYVIYRCSVNILIYLYSKLNCYALILCNSNCPLNYSACFCSAIICRYKLGVCRNLICDCSIYIFSCCVLIGNCVCKFFLRLY